MSEEAAREAEGGEAYPVVGSAGNGGLVPADERLAAAMQMQTEVLRRIAERQESLEEKLKDTRRSDMMIQSTRALNESFQNMKRVQEGLLERLRSGGRGNRSMIFAGVIALALVLFLVAWLVSETLKEARRELPPDPKAATALEAMASFEQRMSSMEQKDREFLEGKLDSLRVSVGTLTAERDTLRAERDRAREELGAFRAKSQELRSELEELKTRKGELERDNARLAERDLTNQRLLRELNEAIAQGRPLPAVAKDEPKPVGGPDEKVVAAAPEKAAKPAGESETSTPLEKPVAQKPAEKPVEKPQAPPAQPFVAGRVDRLNELLSKHRGTDRYRVRSATKTEAGALKDVVLEVRRGDGTLDKTIVAESMRCEIAGSRELIELKFRKGAVTYHSRLKNIRSPFFNDRYSIVILGIDRPAWIAESYPFLQVK